MKITYITSNDLKYQIAREICQNTSIDLSRRKIELYEIQSMDLEQIAKHTAKEASQKCNGMLAVTDAGFFIEALKGFPGPFVKYVNQYFAAEDIIRLMNKVDNRKIVVKECMILIDAKGIIHKYVTDFQGRVSKKLNENEGTTFENIYIPDGYNQPISNWSKEEQLSYWKSRSTWHKVVKDIGKIYD